MNRPPTSTEQRHISTDQFEQQLELVKHKIKDKNAGLFGPNSMMWHVAQHALAGAHGSGRALLLQVAHPWVTKGINDHSTTREDPLARGARTFTAVNSIVFGSYEQACREARIVHQVHQKIIGTIGEDSGAFTPGSHYQANEAHAMLWVHATLWETSILMHETFIKPLSKEQKERYYQETKLFAYMFGIDDDILPPNWPEFMEYNQRMWASDRLTVNTAALELTSFLFKPLHPSLKPVMRWLEIVTAATLPPRLSEAFELRYSQNDKRLFRTGIRAIKAVDKISPKIIKHGPTYLEAHGRLQGKKPGRLIKNLNKRLYGRSELVA